ncbi:MAG: hypothetical protein C4523_03630 [Myxococcales bacterium]|nr:MAG: hypothetical protein C4523_03630 [Myxococcales bacterium]
MRHERTIGRILNPGWMMRLAAGLLLVFAVACGEEATDDAGSETDGDAVEIDETVRFGSGSGVGNPASLEVGFDALIDNPLVEWRAVAIELAAVAFITPGEANADLRARTAEAGPCRGEADVYTLPETRRFPLVGSRRARLEGPARSDRPYCGLALLPSASVDDASGVAVLYFAGRRKADDAPLIVALKLPRGLLLRAKTGEFRFRQGQKQQWVLALRMERLLDGVDADGWTTDADGVIRVGLGQYPDDARTIKRNLVGRLSLLGDRNGDGRAAEEDYENEVGELNADDVEE